jgi:single-stranded DNA-binding protein
MILIKNSVRLPCNIGGEIQTRALHTGTEIARVSTATTAFSRRENGCQVIETLRCNLVAGSEITKSMEAVLSIGKEGLNAGKLTPRSFEDISGQTRSSAEVMVMIQDFMTVIRKATALS